MSPAVGRAVALAVARLAVAAVILAAGALAYRYLLHRREPTAAAVLAATAVVAAGLWALRDPLDRVADRIAFGSRAGGYQAVHALLQEMARALPLDEVVPRLAETAGRTVGGPSAEVRLWLADGSRLSGSWRPEAAAAEAQSLTVDVAHAGDMLGEIAVAVEEADVNAFDRRLLEELAGPAGLALSTVRLTHDLRARREQLAALTQALVESRDRLLSARRGEQQRLRAEVEQRVTGHLDVAIALLDARLDAAAVETAEALDGLRFIARGIYPPMLAESGLAAALDGWLERADSYADIVISDPAGWLGAHPEHAACLYFCAATVLAALHGRRPRVAAAVRDGEVTLVVSCVEPVPLPDAVRTVVADRVGAFDGSVRFEPGRTSAALPVPPPSAGERR